MASHFRILPDSVRVYRLKVLSCFMKAGVPINKMDCFRNILEENSLRLSSSSLLSEMIPVVRRDEETKIRDEVKDKSISIGLHTYVFVLLIKPGRYNSVWFD